MDRKKIVSARELEELGILKRRTALRMAQRGLIPHVRFGAKLAGVGFSQSEVIKALKAGANPITLGEKQRCLGSCIRSPKSDECNLMKWIKHMVATTRDEKMSAYLEDTGLQGYGFYWRLLEIVAEAMSPGDEACTVTYSLSTWSRLLYCHHHQVSKYMGKLRGNSNT